MLWQFRNVRELDTKLLYVLSLDPLVIMIFEQWNHMKKKVEYFQIVNLNRFLSYLSLKNAQLLLPKWALTCTSTTTLLLTLLYWLCSRNSIQV